MDLSKLEAIDDVESADFLIVDPGTSKPVLILTLAGPTHPARRALRPKHEMDLLTAATLDWKSADGTPADQPFDAKIMEALYRDPEKEWLRRQVSAKLANSIGFVKIGSGVRRSIDISAVMSELHG
jgi:hypothetical protein